MLEQPQTVAAYIREQYDCEPKGFHKSFLLIVEASLSPRVDAHPDSVAACELLAYIKQHGD